MNDALSQFCDAIQADGLEPPAVIEPGKLYRFPSTGKRNGNTARLVHAVRGRLGRVFR